MSSQDSACILRIAETVQNLLAARWKEIRDVAESEENDGQISVSAGSLKISFSKKTVDEGVFHVEPETEKLETE